MKDREVMCLSKERYESLSIALSVASEYLRENGMKNRVYECPVCGGYHLSHIRQRQFGRQRKKIQDRVRHQNFNYHKLKHRRIKNH